ncbi:serine/threonine-protein kinase DCLK1-like [Rhopilema esculentum]|uniref:serine/threonine-protein kinase DCLK1-like n=1 Tax=Rhopilema esculentum TaxID=499914 RepID=UPI0031D9E4B9
MKETSEFYQTFKTGNLLGEGNFSSVRECILKKGEGIKYAVKMVKLSGSKEKKEDIKSMMQGEVSVMQKLDCKNIIKCIDAFFGTNEILVVLEFTSDGDLYDYIINTQEVDEDKSRFVMYDIVSAVNYLHSKKIVHRDIKPENFLIFPTNEGSKKIVKLCDFGLAVDARQILTEVCGSPSYVAPEVLRMQNYGLPVDIWSCGIVLYILLCHFPPFYGESTKKLFSKIMRGNYDFPSPYWDDISENAKDLITRMLVVKDDRRIKSEEVVRHPWFNEEKVSIEDGEAETERKASSMSLRGVAIAVRCMQRFAEPVRKPAREQAILSVSFVKSCELEK